MFPPVPLARKSPRGLKRSTSTAAVPSWRQITSVIDRSRNTRMEPSAKPTAMWPREGAATATAVAGPLSACTDTARAAADRATIRDPAKDCLWLGSREAPLALATHEMSRRSRPTVKKAPSVVGCAATAVTSPTWHVSRGLTPGLRPLTEAALVDLNDRCDAVCASPSALPSRRGSPGTVAARGDLLSRRLSPPGPAV